MISTPMELIAAYRQAMSHHRISIADTRQTLLRAQALEFQAEQSNRCRNLLLVKFKPETKTQLRLLRSRLSVAASRGILVFHSDKVTDWLRKQLLIPTEVVDEVAPKILSLAGDGQQAFVLELEFGDEQSALIPFEVAPAISSSPIERAKSREDWLTAIGALPAKDQTLAFELSIPLLTVAYWEGRRDKQNYWTATPDAAWSDQLLHFFAEVRALGYRVTCKLNGASELEVRSVQKRFQGRRHGLYFAPGAEVSLRDGQVEDLSPADIGREHIAHSELVWSHCVTHLVAPTEDRDVPRKAYSLPRSVEKKLLEEIALGGPAAILPWIELKTPVYRFFADVDLPWTLYETSPAFRELKKAQIERLAGADLSYSGLSQLLEGLYVFKPGVLVAVRTGKEDKGGHHLVVPGLRLPNDGRHGFIVAGQLEAATAIAIAQSSIGGTTRFLAEMLLDDRRHLGIRFSPLTFRIRRPPAAQILRAASDTKLLDDTKLLEICASAIELSLRDGRFPLDPTANAELVGFALRSMGELSLERHLNRLRHAKSMGSVWNALRGIARRCRWEILRRARFFDHSVYGSTMGLRLLATIKPGEPESRYLPVGAKEEIGPSTIAQFSIRQYRAKASMPTWMHGGLLSSLGVGFRKDRFSPKSLDGLFMKARVLEEFNVPSVRAEFRILPPESVETKDVRHGMDWFKSYREGLHEVREGVYLEPPKRSGNMGIRYMELPPENDTVNIRVRVYIPSPAVESPGPNFGGDDRSATFGGGSSRLDVDIELNTTTGAISQQAAWGESTGYDDLDTQAVAGKPWWWLEKAPGAQPNQHDTLVASSDNVTSQAQSSASGIQLDISYSGAIPIAPQAPNIDGAFAVNFRSDGTVGISALHDGFPAHSLYINGQLAYGYDPVGAGGDPLSLYPPMDVEDERELPRVPLRPPGALPGTRNLGGPQSRWDLDNYHPDFAIPDFDSRDEVDAEPDHDDDGDGGEGGAGTGDGDDTSTGGANSGGDGDPLELGLEPGQSQSIPLDIEANANGTVTISAGDSSEVFSYDSDLGGWVGDGGSFLMGGPEMFGDTDGWTVQAEVDASGNVSAMLCNGSACAPVALPDSYTP